MLRTSFFGRSHRRIFALALAMVLALASTLVVAANVAVTGIITDPYTTSSSQHKTAVEPDSFSFGSTVVSTVQVGRFFDGGATNIGWATSTNGGGSWTSGVLPGITVAQSGPYSRATDPSVAYDPKHNVWMINSLGLTQNGTSITGTAVVVSRSTNGGTVWGGPVTVASVTGTQDFDKNWIVCDTTSTSPFYGNCYVEFDDFGHNNQLKMYRSTDGGLTWSASTTPNATVIGGQPLVQPNGTVVMPIDNGFETTIGAYVSTNGGVSYNNGTKISGIRSHTEAGSLRSGPLPSAEVDGAGKVYVVWSDCRFRRRCGANDIVMSTSTNGTTWSAVTRIPIDATNSNIDHFIPGIAVDKSTSGATAHIGIVYYYYPVSNCTAATCQLNVGYVASTDGGTTWTTPIQLAGPMTLSWLPNTSQGRMVGDYISSSFSGGKVFGFFPIASVPSSGGSDCQTATPNCNQPLFTNSTGLSSPSVSAPRAKVAADPELSTSSDHPDATRGFKIR